MDAHRHHRTHRRQVFLNGEIHAKGPSNPIPIDSNVAVEDAPPEIQPQSEPQPETAAAEPPKPPLTFADKLARVAKNDWERVPASICTAPSPS